MIFDKSVSLDDNQKNKFLVKKENPRILMLPSDNFNASGAFISMANLVNILRKKYSLNIFVILPEEGEGFKILEEFEIPFV